MFGPRFTLEASKLALFLLTVNVNRLLVVNFRSFKFYSVFLITKFLLHTMQNLLAFDQLFNIEEPYNMSLISSLKSQCQSYGD